MNKKKKTYELEVHFGLLVLVVIMLCLNIASNYVIFSAKNILYDDKSGEIYKVSLTLSRYIQNNKHNEITNDEKLQFLFKFNLNDILLIPSTSKELTDDSKLQWLTEILYDIPIEQIPIISKIILTTEYYKLTRSEGNNYHYVVPVIFGKTNSIIIISKEISELAYLEDASETLANLSIITIISIMLIYMLLYRFILSPFKRLKENATLAGRKIHVGDSEVNSVLEEYQNIIKELKDKESELISLHKQATIRADSFEQFNIYLLESMQAGIILIDNYGKVLTINNSTENICQITSAEYLKKHYSKLPFFSEEIRNKIDETLKQNKSHAYEEYQLANISQQVGLLISPIYDNETDQIGVSVLINDISEIKMLQNEIEKNRQMSALGEMSAGLAHQLRNSLGAIVGYNQLVRKRLVQHNLETTLVDSMVSELQESENLIKRFLNFTKPFDYEPEDEVIIRYVEDIINTLKIREDFSRITLNLKYQFDTMTSVVIDQLLLKQAITNIIENCKNAYDNNTGIVEICLSIENNDQLIITIEDFACGIKSEYIDKIFTPFYSTNPSGTGLGLPLAQKIIALHNGHLQVNSIVGEGTKFKILIPLASKSIQSSSAVIS